jgi:hypothetical protein
LQRELMLSCLAICLLEPLLGSRSTQGSGIAVSVHQATEPGQSPLVPGALLFSVPPRRTLTFHFYTLHLKRGSELWHISAGWGKTACSPCSCLLKGCHPAMSCYLAFYALKMKKWDFSSHSQLSGKALD